MEELEEEHTQWELEEMRPEIASHGVDDYTAASIASKSMENDTIPKS